MKAKLAGLVALVYLVLGGMSAWAQGQIGVVDNLRIMQDYPAARDAQRKIGSFRNELEQQFNALREQLQSDLQSASSDAEKLQLQKDAQAKFEAQKAKYDSMVETLRQDIDGSIEQAIQQVAQEQGLDLVVSNTVTYYGGQDITDAVLAKLGR